MVLVPVWAPSEGMDLCVSICMLSILNMTPQHVSLGAGPEDTEGEKVREVPLRESPSGPV